jgi:hypothetical protein
MDYPGIRAWCTLLRSQKWYEEAQLNKARTWQLPEDTIYCHVDDDGVATYATVRDMNPVGDTAGVMRWLLWPDNPGMCEMVGDEFDLGGDYSRTKERPR